MKRLNGKSAIITGAARGIGKAFAKAYVQEGATVAIADVNAPGVVDGDHWDGVDALFARYENRPPAKKSAWLAPQCLSDAWEPLKI